MLKLKVRAVIAAVLMMSSVSAEAMEFDDLPVLISGITFDEVSSLSAIRVISTDDFSRRQINRLNILLPVTVEETKLVYRPKPISNVIPTKLSHSDRPGRLSAEFTRVARGSGIRFEYGPGVVASWLKSAAMSTAMKFEDRPGTVSNRFKTLAVVSIKIADRRGFTSSLAKTKTPFGLHLRPSSVEFCVGSIAPCGPLHFVQRSEKHDS